jgi:hypothetical protein
MQTSYEKTTVHFSPRSLLRDSSLETVPYSGARPVVLPYDVGDRATWGAVVVCSKKRCMLPCEYERRRPRLCEPPTYPPLVVLLAGGTDKELRLCSTFRSH